MLVAVVGERIGRENDLLVCGIALSGSDCEVALNLRHAIVGLGCTRIGSVGERVLRRTGIRLRARYRVGEALTSYEAYRIDIMVGKWRGIIGLGGGCGGERQGSRGDVDGEGIVSIDGVIVLLVARDGVCDSHGDVVCGILGESHGRSGKDESVGLLEALERAWGYGDNCRAIIWAIVDSRAAYREGSRGDLEGSGSVVDNVVTAINIGYIDCGSADIQVVGVGDAVLALVDDIAIDKDIDLGLNILTGVDEACSVRDYLLG